MHSAPNWFPTEARAGRKKRVAARKAEGFLHGPALRKVRITLNRYAQPVSHLHVAKKTVFNFALRHLVPSVTTRWFMSFGIFHALLTQGRLPRDPSSIELMVHPAAATYMKAPAEYEDELVKLGEDWREHLPWEHRLISYNDL